RRHERLQRQADPLAIGLDAEHAGRDAIAGGDRITRVGHRAVHQFRQMYQAVDSRGQFDEGAEVGQADDIPLDDIPLVEPAGHIGPGIGFERLERQADPLLRAAEILDLDDTDRDFLPLLEHIRGVGDTGAGKFGDMGESFDAPQVDERPERRQAPDDTLDILPLGQSLPTA
ncbi:MAG: hypothetical protein FD129_3250, partial [bacterium]